MHIACDIHGSKRVIAHLIDLISNEAIWLSLIAISVFMRSIVQSSTPMMQAAAPIIYRGTPGTEINGEPV